MLPLRLPILCLVTCALCALNGCALQYGGGDSFGVWGLAHVEECRIIEPTSNRAARVLQTRVLGLSASLTSMRVGLLAGYGKDTRIDFFAFDEAAENGVRRWVEELSDSGDDALRATKKYIPLTPRSFAPPPASVPAARRGGIEVLGADLNKLEPYLHLSAGYSKSDWMLGYPDDPPIAFTISENGTRVDLYPIPAQSLDGTE